MNCEEKRNILFLDSNEKAILQLCAFFSKLSCSHNKLAHLYGADFYFKRKKKNYLKTHSVSNYEDETFSNM